jgi:hypothetical protein
LVFEPYLLNPVLVKTLSMSRSESKKIDLFLSVSRRTLNDYFNPHDPSPIYKKQLHHDFVKYITEALTTYTRYTTLRFKVSCNKEDKELVEPFMQALRRHYTVQEQLVIKEFRKFKKKSFKLLLMSLGMVMICHGLLPMILPEEHGIGATIMNSIDVFSWVILWKPIDRLIFGWNPYLKDISMYTKLLNAEVIVMEYASNALELETKLRASA